MLEPILACTAVFFSGLLAGSLLLEGLVLVPFWKKLSFAEFFGFHHLFGAALFRYFAPLTTLAVTAPVVAALTTFGHNLWFGVSAIISIAVLLFFPLYFKRANEAFTNKEVTEAELPGRLVLWERIHALRTIVALVAFGAAVLGLQSIP
jgi:Domain of unknown function (DUF1772)